MRDFCCHGAAEMESNWMDSGPSPVEVYRTHRKNERNERMRHDRYKKTQIQQQRCTWK